MIVMHILVLTYRDIDEMVDIFSDIFQCMFLNKNLCVLIAISLKFVPESPMDNPPALVYMMAWPVRATSHYLNGWLSTLFSQIYVSLGLKILNRSGMLIDML